eukprot:scaffold45589_cov67-Phaeocystis_antarctica.AAC.2
MPAPMPLALYVSRYRLPHADGTANSMRAPIPLPTQECLTTPFRVYLVRWKSTKAEFSRGLSDSGPAHDGRAGGSLAAARA